DPGLLDVEDLAPDRQDRLYPRVAALPRRPTRRVALDDEDLSLLGVGGLTVRQLARQAAPAQQALAAARQVAGLACRHPGRGGGDRLADDVSPLARVLLEPLAELIVDHLLHERPGL